MSVGREEDGCLRKVLLCELGYFRGSAVGFVPLRTASVLLDEGVDLSFHEFSVTGCRYGQYRCIARPSGYVDAIRRTEIAQAVGDEAVFV
mgnify:CR=1 FL=1